MVVGHGKKRRAWLYVYVYVLQSQTTRVTHNQNDRLEKKDWDDWTLDGRETLQPHCPSVFWALFNPFFPSFLFLSSTVFLCSTRRDEETDRDDAASNASRLVILEAQVLLRILHRSRAHRRSRAETHPRHRSNGYGDILFLSLFCFITILYLPTRLDNHFLILKIKMKYWTKYLRLHDDFSPIIYTSVGPLWSNQICFQWTGIMQVAGEFCGVFPSIRGTSVWSCAGCMPSTASTLSSALTLSLIPTFPTRASSEWVSFSFYFRQLCWMC